MTTERTVERSLPCGHSRAGNRRHRYGTHTLECVRCGPMARPREQCGSRRGDAECVRFHAHDGDHAALISTRDTRALWVEWPGIVVQITYPGGAETVRL